MKASSFKRGYDRSARGPMKVIFLDRDGVINKDPGGWTKYNYVTKSGEIIFLPGALEALGKLRRHGYSVIIISNQAGVSKGFFSLKNLDVVNSIIVQEASRAGGQVLESFY